ncbi:MAG TPA: hypothetical protein VFQ32_13965 [Ktedonobacterales bacterium]|nr:hypothetical protein [Ktedonobacterales bacterium]
MARRERKRGLGSRLFGLINPVRDPSLLVAIILTVIEKGNPMDNPGQSALFLLLNWIAVKGAIWLLVNFAFSFVYLMRKGLWAMRHPRLAWRLLDAMGTEEIIIGGLRPDMFTTEDGSLHEGQLAYGMGMGGLAGGYAPGYGQGALGPGGYGRDDEYDDYGRDAVPSMRLDERSEELREMLTAYSGLIEDWMAFTEEKWRAVSDSQLGWKPLRGRWNGWEQIYGDSFNAVGPNAADNTTRRFDNSQSKGSAASAVACFLRDLDMLRQGMIVVESGEQPQAPRAAGFGGSPSSSSRTGKAPIIKNPMIVDAD